MMTNMLECLELQVSILVLLHTFSIIDEGSQISGLWYSIKLCVDGLVVTTQMQNAL